MNVVTTNIEQAILHIQSLPVQEQQKVFDYIDLMMLKYQENNQENNDKR